MTDRRTFLTGAALSAGLALADVAKPPTRVIDTHTHFYDPSRPQGVPWPAKDDSLLYRTTLPRDFKKVVEGLGVTGTIVVEASPWPEDNQWILDLAKDDPLIVGFVGHLEPGASTFKEHLVRFTKNPLFRGIRLNGKAITAGLPQPGFMADLQRLADVDLELDAIGDETMFPSLAALCDRVPRLRIVIDHLPFDHPRIDLLREVGRRPQIYAKVSGVVRSSGNRVPDEVSFYKQALDELWNAFGRDRVLYGSNWPVCGKIAPYPTVMKIVREYFAAKGPEATERYFWKNSLAAYKWVNRPQG